MTGVQTCALPISASADRREALAGLQSEDEEVLIAAKTSTLYMDTSYLQTESIRAKVRDWIATGRQPRPEATDPGVLPRLHERTSA